MANAPQPEELNNQPETMPIIENQQVVTEQRVVTEPPQIPNIEVGPIPITIAGIVLLVSIGIAWGTLKTTVNHIEKTLDDNIKPDLKDITKRLRRVETRVATLWQGQFSIAKSPRQLNDKANRILEESGIDKIIEREKDKLLEIVKSKNPSNAYDAERLTLEVAQTLLIHCPDVEDELKKGAFNTGESVDEILFIGGMHLRNLIFPELNFTLEEVDKTQPKKAG